jgi:predicted CXXCH cytochrome family protein
MTRKSSIAILAGMLLGLMSVLGSVQAGEAVEGSAKADKLDECVAPTQDMRRNHFEMIKHQRDLTVHQGIRKTDDSLAGCVDCHAQKDAAGAAVAVNSEGQFCAGCHEYAAVSIDCFSCHTAVPGGK